MNVTDYWTNANYSIQKYWADHLGASYEVAFSGFNVDIEESLKTKTAVFLVENFSFEKVEQSINGMEGYTYGWANDTTLTADAAKYSSVIEVADDANMSRIKPIRIGSQQYTVMKVEDNTITLGEMLVSNASSGDDVQLVSQVDKKDLTLWKGQMNFRIMTGKETSTSNAFLDMQTAKGVVASYLDNKQLSIYETDDTDTGLYVRWHQEEIMIQDIPTAYDEYNQCVVQIPCYAQMYMDSQENIITTITHNFNVL